MYEWVATNLVTDTRGRQTCEMVNRLTKEKKTVTGFEMMSYVRSKSVSNISIEGSKMVMSQDLAEIFTVLRIMAPKGFRVEVVDILETQKLYNVKIYQGYRDMTAEFKLLLEGKKLTKSPDELVQIHAEALGVLGLTIKAQMDSIARQMSERPAVMVEFKIEDKRDKNAKFSKSLLRA